jgi:hypothetical protein
MERVQKKFCFENFSRFLSSEEFFEITANSFMVLNERERTRLKSKKQPHPSYYYAIGENPTPKLYPEFNRKIEEF